MLLNHFDTMHLANDYADFVSALTKFKVLCAEKWSKRKTDYEEHFENLKGIFDDLVPKNERYGWIERELDSILKKIKRILHVKRLTNNNIDEIGYLLDSFESKIDYDVRMRLFENRVERDIRRYYPEKLFQAVYNLMENEEYESAILAAFKYLDSHVKSVLGAKSNDLFGEELINFAFSPKSGVIQLQSHPNEQNGIRNFFSGANAIFRNPSAHRFVDYDETTAETIIAMVAMMANLASRIKESTKRKPK